VSIDDVADIDLLKEGLQIACLQLVIVSGEDRGETAIGVVLPPRLILTAFKGTQVLGEGEGVDLHLITSSPELGEDIGGEEPRIAVGDVGIEVMYSTQAIEKAFKSSDLLNLVKKEVVHRRIDHPLFDIRTKELGIQYILVLLIVEGMRMIWSSATPDAVK
jgi:hypothetical protein